MNETSTVARVGLTQVHPSWWERLLNSLSKVRVSRRPRRLRLCESLSLGDKRFVAVIQYESQQFLIGGGTSSLNLLARLGESSDFASVMTEWCERQR